MNLMKRKQMMQGEPEGKKNPVISYTSPISGTTVSVDTTGYAAGQKRFPAKFDVKYVPTVVGGGMREKPHTIYGSMNRKMATRSIEASQGKKTKRIGMSTSGVKKSKEAFGVPSKKSKYGVMGSK